MSAPAPGTTRRPRLGPALARGVRRALIPFALALVLLLISVPATQDLDRLCKWLAGIFLVLGLVIWAATTYVTRDDVAETDA